MPLVSIDPERCRKEGLCVRICRKNFVQEDRTDIPRFVRDELCNNCGHCVLICPHGALRHAGFTPGDVAEIRKDCLPSYEAVMEMIRARRSIRNFLDRPVEREIVEKIIEGARFAPSAKNAQSTRYMVIRDRDLLKEVAEATAAWLGRIAQKLKNPFFRTVYLLKGDVNAEEIGKRVMQFKLIRHAMQKGDDMILFHAPALILFHADRTVRFAETNANLAVENASFVCGSLGLGCFYTGYVTLACVRNKRIRKLIGLPEKHRVYGGLAMGYPAIAFSRRIERNPPEIIWK